MFSSGDNQNGIGLKWVQWSLPEGREGDSLWTHSVGFNTVSKAKMYPVTVKVWNGKEQVCMHDILLIGLLFWLRVTVKDHMLKTGTLSFFLVKLTFHCLDIMTAKLLTRFKIVLVYIERC